MKKILLLIFIATLFLFSCEKVNEEPVFDLVPKIELLEYSQDTLIEFVDQLTLKISYEDGDGDLGNSDADVNSLFVKDARLTNEDEYYIAPLAPEDAKISITGTLNVQLSATFLLGNGTKETTIYTIYVRDRSGNQSNIIETPPITILEN